MEYLTIQKKGIEDFNKEVNDLVNAKWFPCSNFTVIKVGHDYIYIQQFTRTKKNNDN